MQCAHPSFFSFLPSWGICFSCSSKAPSKGPLSHTTHVWRVLARRGWPGLSQAPRTCLGACSHLTEVSGCSFTTVLGKLQHRLWPLPIQFQWCFVLTASVLCSEQRVEPSWFAIPGNCRLGSQFQQHLFHSNLTTPNSLYLWISKHVEREGASACLRCSWTSPGSSSSEQMRGNKPRMVWRTSRLESLHWGLTAREFSAHIWENSWIHIIQIKDFPLRTWINKQVITGVCASSTQLAGFLPVRFLKQWKPPAWWDQHANLSWKVLCPHSTYLCPHSLTKHRNKTHKNAALFWVKDGRRAITKIQKLCVTVSPCSQRHK